MGLGGCRFGPALRTGPLGAWAAAGRRHGELTVLLASRGTSVTWQYEHTP
jgi:hypothetical protein